MLRKGVKLELKKVSVVYRFVYTSMWFMVRYVVFGHGCWLSQFLLSFCGRGEMNHLLLFINDKMIRIQAILS